MTERYLKIDFAGYWHTGTGQSSGTYLDSVTEKNRFSLPFVAGKHLKGIIRHAVRRAECWSWFELEIPPGPAESLEMLLFGSNSQCGPRSETIPGMLLLSDACLAESEAAYLRQDAKLIPHLYQPLYSTAIGESGAAQPHSLRGIEVCLPVTLFCQLRLDATSVDPEHRAQQEAWLSNGHCWQWLETTLSLVDSLGASRTRGLGEAILTAHETLPEGVA